MPDADSVDSRDEPAADEAPKPHHLGHRDRLRERAVWLAEISMQEGFRFSPRLHVDLWGNRRGV